MKQIIIKDCEDWTFTQIIDGETNKVIVQIEYDDGPYQCCQKMKKILEYVGVTVIEMWNNEIVKNKL